MGARSLAVVSFMLVVLPMAVSAQDACQSKIPETLKSELTKRFPGYALPRVQDNEKTYIQMERKSGRDGCLGVASGDFDGNRQTDFAILLSAARGSRIKLVAALRDGKSWKIAELPSWCPARESCFVDRGGKGVYERHISFDKPIDQPDERQSVRAFRSVIISGKLEATGVAYIYEGTKWVYVWFSA
jgi:hypothetical protein